MTTIALTPKQLTARLKQDAERYPAALKHGLRRGAQRGRTLLVHESPVDTGQFKNAWKVRDLNSAPQIHNDAPHAGIIERGARPHPVSREGVDAIRAWVKRVLGADLKAGTKTQPKAAQKGEKRFMGKYRRMMHEREFEAAVDNVVWAIITKLKREGQVGKFIVQDNLEKLARFAREEVERVLAAFFNRPMSGGGATP